MSKFVDTQSVSIGVSIAAGGGSEPSLFARGPAAYTHIGAATEEVLRETILPMVARLRG